MDKILEVNQSIISKRTGKVLRCYNVSEVYIGAENKLIRYEYRFYDDAKAKFKTIRHGVLQNMLNGVWSIIKE